VFFVQSLVVCSIDVCVYRKWIHVFDSVSAVVFVVSLPDYDTVLFEDETTNQLMEAFAVFEEVSTNFSNLFSKFNFPQCPLSQWL